MITDAEIEAALKLCEAATPGEWKTFIEKNSIDGRAYFPTETVHIIAPDPDQPGAFIYVPETLKDKLFVAAARTLLPKALQEIKDLRLALTQVQHNAMVDRHDGAEVAKLRAENEKLRMDAALKTGYVEAVVGYDELRRIIHNLRAENKELIGEIEDARVALSHLLSGEEITKLRAENEQLQQAIEENKDGLAIKRQVACEIVLEEAQKKIQSLRAENAKLWRVKEAAENLAKRHQWNQHLGECICVEHLACWEALKALDEEGK